MKQLLIFTYLIISLFLFGTFHTSALVWVSFFINWSILSIIFVYHLYIEKTFSPFISSFTVFSFLFFTIAPIIQINSFNNLSNPVFANHFIYKKELALYSNLLIFIFYIVFFTSYFFFKNKKKPLKQKTLKFEKRNRPLYIMILVLLSVLVAIVTFNYTLELLVNPYWKKSSYSTMKILIYGKVLYFIPLGGIFLSYDYLQKKKFKNFNFAYIALSLIFFLVLLLWFKNPMTEKRNALGPIYITLIYLFFPKILNTNVKFLTFLFFSMVVVFPLTSIVTHIKIPLSEISLPVLIEHFQNEDVFKAYKTLHYDAFSSIMVSIEYVQQKGLSMGNQLLSTLLFFVPRSLWVSKPYSSGTLIGNYLIDNYNFNFSNLSNPIVSEGYLNFGIIGVIIIAIILAYFIVYMISWIKSSSIIKHMLAFYFSVHLMFLLRGDLTNGVTYFVGVIIGVLLFYKYLNGLINILFKKANEQKK